MRTVAHISMTTRTSRRTGIHVFGQLRLRLGTEKYVGSGYSGGRGGGYRRGQKGARCRTSPSLMCGPCEKPVAPADMIARPDVKRTTVRQTGRRRTADVRGTRSDPARGSPRVRGKQWTIMAVGVDDTFGQRSSDDLKNRPSGCRILARSDWTKDRDADSLRRAPSTACGTPR